MHILTADNRKVKLRHLSLSERPSAFGPEFDVGGSEDSSRFSRQVTTAARTSFEMGVRKIGAKASSRKGRPPAAFVEEESGLLRTVYKEVVLRFRPKTQKKTRDKILKKYGFSVRKKSAFARDQFIVYHPQRKHACEDLLDISNDWTTMDEVEFSSPNFVSEFRRGAQPTIHKEQWHLLNTARHFGQLNGEDVNAREAWKETEGGDTKVTVAVLDDGIDVEHPDFRHRIKRNPDPNEPNDKVGRDFFLTDTHPDHFNPRPKLFRDPFDQLEGNDIHGTPCAGVIASSGKPNDVSGISFRSRILPVKIFHADNLASESAVADAIRYASLFADIISCSWSGPDSDAIRDAIRFDAAQGRAGRGVAVFCATGNGFSARPIPAPAKWPETIAVGASTDQAKLAAYSNTGAEVSIVAPSNGGVRGIFTADVSFPNRGFNLGTAGSGGVDGLHTNDFGGTSSATPLAAGVGALLLGVNSELTREDIRQILQSTADKIGSGHVNGHSKRFGHGRVNAEAAVDAAIALGGQ